MEQVFHAPQDIIGVQHCVFGNLLQPISTMAEDISECPREHAHLAMEGDHTAKGFGGFALYLFDQAEAIIITPFP